MFARHPPLAFASLLFICTPLHAVNGPPELVKKQKYSAAYKKCVENPAQHNSADMLQCIDAEHKRQVTRLTKAYNKVRVDLTAERKKQLQVGQSLWMKFQSANCDFYYDPEGGTSAKLDAGLCLLDSTEQRATELESFTKQ